jgi:transposase InsO family protein
VACTIAVDSLQQSGHYAAARAKLHCPRPSRMRSRARPCSQPSEPVLPNRVLPSSTQSCHAVIERSTAPTRKHLHHLRGARLESCFIAGTSTIASAKMMMGAGLWDARRLSTSASTSGRQQSVTGRSGRRTVICRAEVQQIFFCEVQGCCVYPIVSPSMLSCPTNPGAALELQAGAGRQQWPRRGHCGVTFHPGNGACY